MTVGIADVAPLLVLVLLRRRQELSAPGAPLRVHVLDVPDPDIEEAADPAGIARRLQRDGGRASAYVDDDPAIGQCHIGQPTRTGEDDPAAQHLGVKAPGPLDVVRDDEVGQHDSLRRRREPGHLAPPRLTLSPAYPAAGPISHASARADMGERPDTVDVTDCPQALAGRAGVWVRAPGVGLSGRCSCLLVRSGPTGNGHSYLSLPHPRPGGEGPSVRSDIVPGGAFPDYALPDHTGTVRSLAEIQ